MPPQHVDVSYLMKELEEHNDFFDDLVDMIPAKLYVGNHATSEPSKTQSKYQKVLSDESKDAKKAKMKLEKLNKFDPSQQESTRDRKRRLENEADDKSGFNEDSDDDEDNSLSDINFQDNHEEEEDDEQNTEANIKAEKGNQSKNSAHQSRIEELRAKLRAKLEERKNASVANGKSDVVVSKRAARRAEKRRRLELAKKKHAVSAGSTHTGKTSAPTVKIVKDLGGSKINSDTKHSNFMDDLSGIDFGGIAGLKDDLLTKGRYTSVNKSLKNLGKKKNLEKLLQEAEAKKARLRQLKESDDAEDKEKAKKIEWSEALKVANGEKIRDTDPSILKKALKRKAKKKAKSQEAWKSRMEQTKEKMDERQTIRNHNIKQRALGGMAGANLSKKRIKDMEVDEKEGATPGGEAKKRARLGPYSGKGRAGFEGKKRDFINKGGNKKNMKTQ